MKQIHELEHETAALQMASINGYAQVTFVKSRADAESLSKLSGAACWHSKLDEAAKSQAMLDFRQGRKKLVSTYGLGAGMNLMVRGIPPVVLCPNNCRTNSATPPPSPPSYFNRFVAGQ
jgi:hypothetical protein